MATQFYGSIDVTELLKRAAEKHSAFNKSDKNQHVYCNINVWLNDEPDKYGNVMAIKFAATKKALEADPEQGKIYLGNCKESEEKPPQQLTDKDALEFTKIADDLPF